MMAEHPMEPTEEPQAPQEEAPAPTPEEPTTAAAQEAPDTAEAPAEPTSSEPGAQESDLAPATEEELAVASPEHRADDAPAEEPLTEAADAPPVEDAPTEQPASEATQAETAPATSTEPTETGPEPAIQSTPASEADTHEPPITENQQELSASQTQEPPAEAPPEEENDLAEVVAQNQVQLEGAVGEMLQTEVSEFEARIKAASLQELALLMEALAQRTVDRDNIRRAGTLKKVFDENYTSALDALKADETLDLETSNAAKAQYLEASKRFNSAMRRFSKNKQEYEQKQQAERQKNTVKKQNLLEELRKIVIEDENAGAIDRVRAIQEEWKEIGHVLQSDADEIYRTYRAYLDQFYTLFKQFKELRDQDKKVNLTKKKELIQQVKALIPEDPADMEPKYWQESGDLVKSLFEQWKKTGPVPRDESENVWEEFKTATDTFHDMRREFFSQLDELREQNTEAKEALLERLRPYQRFSAEDMTGWNDAAEEVKALQEEWRTIGPALREKGKALFQEFRDINDAFFQARKAFFKQFDKQKDEILAQKRAMLEEAQTLAESEDWQTTAQRLKDLQQEWKALPRITNKEGSKLHRAFQKACNTFFTRQKTHFKELKDQEKVNFEQKEALLAELEALMEHASLSEEQKDRAEKIIQAYKDAGRVPIKKKRPQDDRFYDLSRAFQKKAGRETNLRPVDVPGSKRGGPKGGKGAPKGGDPNELRLKRLIEELNEEILQLETNIQFLSSSKSTEPLRKEIQAKIDVARNKQQKLKEELKEVQVAKRQAAKAKEEADAAATEGNTMAEETPASESQSV